MKLAALAVALALFAGCDEKERAARSEAASVSRAIDALRTAENAEKAGPLAALRAVVCTVPDICAAKSYCQAAYEKHVAALDLIAEAKASMAKAPAASVAETLKAADASLHLAKSATDACATRQGEMVRRYRVGR